MAKLITDIDTNTVYFSWWISELKVYENIKEILNNYGITNQLLPHTKDYWVRDYMPIQISETKFIQYRYNPDYLQNKKNYITNSAFCNQSIGIITTNTDLIIDGGNIIKCEDCIIMTDKVFSENPNLSRIDLINKLESFFQVEIIFLPWDKYERYGHADGMVRFIGGNKILLNNYINFDKRLRNVCINILKNKFHIKELNYKALHSKKNSWAYINFLQVGKLILLPSLNRIEDEIACSQFEETFKGYHIEQIDVREIVKLGGALNCISWNIKN